MRSDIVQACRALQCGFAVTFLCGFQSLHNHGLEIISKSEMAQQNDRLDDERYKTLLKSHLNMGCLDEAERLTQERCTKGIRANGLTFNELLHARAFACAGAGGRPWHMSPSAAWRLLDRGKAEASSLLTLTLSKRMTEITISFGTTLVGLLATNGLENGPFVGKREARDAEFPSWAEGWLQSWFVERSSALWAAGRESAELSRPRATRPVRPLTSWRRPPSPGRCTATRACGTRQRAHPRHAAAREEAFRSPPHDCAIDDSTPLCEC